MKSHATTLYPFVPSGPSFTTALDFFAELGFAKSWQHEGLAGLRFGGAYFMLQDIDVPEWQKNQMITFEVDDLDVYWSEIESRICRGASQTCERDRRQIFPGAVKFTSLIPAGSVGTSAKPGRRTTIPCPLVVRVALFSPGVAAIVVAARFPKARPVFG